MTLFESGSTAHLPSSGLPPFYSLWPEYPDGVGIPKIRKTHLESLPGKPYPTQIDPSTDHFWLEAFETLPNLPVPFMGKMEGFV